MPGGCRADMAGEIGAGRADGAIGFAQQRMRNRMGGDTNSQGLKPGRSQKRDRAVRASWQNQGQRAGPERPCKRARPIVEHGQILGGGGIGDVGDQRVELRPPLGSEDGGNRIVVGGVAAKTVDGFGRERDQLPGTQQRCRLRERLAVPGTV